MIDAVKCLGSGKLFLEGMERGLCVLPEVSRSASLLPPFFLFLSHLPHQAH